MIIIEAALPAKKLFLYKEFLRNFGGDYLRGAIDMSLHVYDGHKHVYISCVETKKIEVYLILLYPSIVDQHICGCLSSLITTINSGSMIYS